MDAPLRGVKTRPWRPRALEPLRGGDSGGELCRLEGGDERPRDGLVDLDAADVETIDAAALDQDLAGAMIPRRGAASAVPAGGQALQQSAPFPHGAAHFVRSGTGILGDAILVGLISPPIDEARMMVRNEHLPFGARQFSDALSADARCIQHRLPSGFAISVGAGIDGICENMVDGGVAGLDPADLGALMHLQRECKPFGAKP